MVYKILDLNVVLKIISWEIKFMFDVMDGLYMRVER